MGSVPKLKELSAKHADQGLVLIGVHSTRGGEKMADFVKENGINYPVAVDRDKAMVTAFGVDGYPDYHVIDRSGNVRVADLRNGELETAILALLNEPVPASAAAAIPAPLQAAAATAQRKATRILSVFGTADERAAFDKVAGADRSVGTLLLNEFTVAMVDSVEHSDLLRSYGTSGDGVLVAHDERGEILSSRPLAGLDGKGLTEFLTANQIPQKNAEELWSRAKAQAEREQKRVLVHLGAPW